MSQGDEFELQGEATTNPEREEGTEGGQKREHAYDGMTAASKTLCFLGLLSFEQAQVCDSAFAWKIDRCPSCLSHLGSRRA